MVDVLDFLVDDTQRIDPRSPAGYVPVIETGVLPGEPLSAQAEHLSNYDKVERAAATAEMEALFNGELEIEPADAALARSIFGATRDVTPYEMQHKPAMLINLQALITEFDFEAVADATWIRNYVTNRLLRESDGKNARDRLSALDKLGKLTDVAAFTDRSEITINTQSTESLEATLRSKIDKILGKPIEGEVLE